MQDAAIMIRENNNSGAAMAFTGTLTYVGDFVSANRTYNLSYKSGDNMILKQEYTKEQFFSNEIIQNKQFGSNVEWQFYLEPYTIIEL